MPGPHLDLLATLRREFRLDWRGVHGAPHWARVRRIGLRLAPLTGADPAVVELFALIHDGQRRNDHGDPGHGARAAKFALRHRGSLFDVSDGQLELLTYACRHHTSGWIHDDPTIGTCWDSDRLDLGRVGTWPHPSRLSTEAARDPGMIRWAFERSIVR